MAIGVIVTILFIVLGPLLTYVYIVRKGLARAVKLEAQLDEIYRQNHKHTHDSAAKVTTVIQPSEIQEEEEELVEDEQQLQVPRNGTGAYRSQEHILLEDYD